jgi:hypothetical protein
MAAAIAAQNAQNALRLKQSQEGEFTNALKLLDGQHLTDTNWSEYKRTILRFAYTYEWAGGLLDLTVNAGGALANVWNNGTETAEQRQDRKNIYMLLVATGGKYKHVYHAVPLGDAQAAWKIIHDELDASTPAEFAALTTQFFSANQAHMGKGVSEFITAIEELARHLSDHGQAVTDAQKTVVLMKGLHKEFEVITTQIQLKPAQTWAATVKEVKAFGKFKNLHSLCFSGALGDAVGSRTFMANKQSTFYADVQLQCRQWQNTGDCDSQWHTL